MVKWYVAGFTNRTGINIETDIPCDIQRLTPNAEVAILPGAQECLTNVHRYWKVLERWFDCRILRT